MNSSRSGIFEILSFAADLGGNERCIIHAGVQRTELYSIKIRLYEFQLNPQPGLEQSITLVVSFHYVFVTKVDKAYTIE